MKRAYDQRPLAADTKLSRNLPIQISPEEAAVVGEAAETMSTYGTGAISTSMFTHHFVRFNLNGILGNVRNLQFVTHLVMM